MGRDTNFSIPFVFLPAMLKKSVFLLTILCLSVFQLIAQNNLSGIVVDKVTKEAIPFVNVQALPSNQGSITDFDGNFILKSKSSNTSLRFTSMGYEAFTYTIQNKTETDIYIELNPISIQIEETVVQGKKNKNKIAKDTLAISLQQLVVDNKENNRPRSFDSYQFREHTKIEFDFYKLGEKFTSRKLLKPFSYSHEFIDTSQQGVKFLPLMLQEKITEVYFQNEPNMNKEILLGQYMTGIQNMSSMVLLSEIFENFDLYDNLIIAGGKSFTSPFSVSGLVTYRYYLTDSLKEEDKTFYKLNFTPRSKDAMAFNGAAWVDAESYAIKSIEFTMPKQANINFIGDFRVQQSFMQVEGDKWILKGEEIQIALNPTGKKNGKSLMITKNMERGDIQIDVPIDPKVFLGERYIISDSLNTNGRDTTWWKNNRVEELNSTEKGVIMLSDSIEKTNAFRNLVWFGNLATTAFLKFGPIEIGRFYQLVSWNSIEGIRPKFGIRTNKDFNENIQLWGYLAYGTKDKQFKYFANTRIMLPRKNNNWHTLDLTYKKDFTFLGQDYEDQQFSHDNMFLALLRTTPLQNIMLQETVKATHEKQWVNGYTTKITVGTNTFFAVEDIFDFDRLNDDGSVTSIEKFNVSEIGIDQHIAFGQTFFENDYYRFEALSNQPIIDISYRLGLRNIAGGDFSYHKLELSLNQRLSSKAGYTYYTISGGKIFGDIPYPLMFIPIGNQNSYLNSVAYNLMREFEFAADEYAAIWMEHHFDGAIFNRIPLVRKLNIRSLVSVKTLIGNAKQSNLDIVDLPEGMRTPENWYVEAGFGIENILQLIRVDFYWRVTQRNVIDVPNFGIKFAIGPKL